ncbi:esterase/lipase family protein [Corallincola platygyrae]|uniref:Esterase/lipase family protein n=1 Tax=Corallincola platygyrae TaxID=1193278 RepID=A0ABW4XHR6_9GAMM
MTKWKSKDLIKHLRASDLRGISLLGTQAVTGVTRISEGVHQSVWRSVGAPKGKSEGQTRGITRISYASIYAITTLLGKSADAVLQKLQPVFDAIDKDKPSTPEREAIIATLNGVVGDRLEESANPLATPMSLRFQGQLLTPECLAREHSDHPSPRILLMIHGLCMNDLQWNAKDNETVVNHGEMLAEHLGYTPVYLRYNSGRHISQNGKELSMQLEQLFSDSAEQIKEIAVVAHSMGGLVIRSACYYGEQQQCRWLQRVNKIVYLGTPHHGAPLEKAGSKVDVVLDKTPYTAPFVRLTKLRSAGITDLRYGYLVDDDWMDQHGQPHRRSDTRPNEHQHVALTEHIDHYCIAATTASRRSMLANHLVGDGLVPLNSALGQQKDPDRTLAFLPSNQWVAFQMTHMELLSHPDVTRRLMNWLEE